MHQSQLSPPSSSHRNHHYSPTGSNGSFHSPHQTPPTTPPAANVSELEERTFARLKRNNISPSVDRSIRLLACAGRKEESRENLAMLKNDLLQCLVSTCPVSIPMVHQPDDDLDSIPDNSTRFLSLTMTDTDPISLFIESRFLECPSNSTSGPLHTLNDLRTSLLGSRGADDILIPITLDLTALPLEATGIVCGVAGRLANDSGVLPTESVVEISFLSTAKGGTVLVKEQDLDRAVQALEKGFEDQDEEEEGDVD